MYKFDVSANLQNILKKLSNRDVTTYNRILDKINEVTNSENVEHYKNLRADMKDSKRVQIGHFVLVFKYDKNTNRILFDDFDHHDTIYK